MEEQARTMSQTFDEMLSEGGYREEFDNRVAAAVQEAQALAQMTQEERMNHDFMQRESQLQAREAEISRRELRAQAAQLLQEHGLPAVLADALNYDSAEALQHSVDAAESAFRAAVQQEVQVRMRGSVPTSGRAAVQQDVSDDEYYASHYKIGG